MGFIDFLGDNLVQFWEYTGFANCTLPHLAMILVGLFFIYLAIKKNFEPMLLVPIGFGILIGNIPFKIDAGLEVGIYEEGSVLNILYQGVSAGWYPPLVFLGIGAMTDFSSLIANPKLMLVGAAAQFGIFRGLYGCFGYWFCSRSSWCNRHYRWSRWSYGYIPIIETGAESYGGHCGFGIFLYGLSSGYTASYHEVAYNEERTGYSYETGACGFSE